MNVQSSIKVLVETEPDISVSQVILLMFRRIPQYAMCAGLGMLGGAVGVALTIGLAILIQESLAPTVVFSPGIIPFMVIATVLSVGTSWLLARVAYHVLSNLLLKPRDKGLQVILVFSVFTSLSEILLFFA